MTARSRERGSHAGRPRSYGLPFTVPGLSGLGTPGSFLHGWRSASAAVGPLRLLLRPSRRGAGAPATRATAQLTPGAGPVARSRRGPGAWQRPAAPARAAPAPQPGGVPRPNGAPHHGVARARVARHVPAERGAGAAAGTASRRSGGPCYPRSSGWPPRSWSSSACSAVGFADGFGGEGSPTPTVASFLLDWQKGHYAAGGRPHQRRHRAGERAARGRLHRPRRDQLVLRP